jgi:hypothetical protein
MLIASEGMLFKKKSFYIKKDWGACLGSGQSVPCFLKGYWS